jgi:hypothetical protein
VQHALLTDGTAFDVDADDAEQEVSDRLRLGHGRRRLGQEHAALELLERLAALVPPPRRPLLAYLPMCVSSTFVGPRVSP